MLTIKQNTTTITIDVTNNILLTSRLINNKLYQLPMELDGTIGDCAAKCNRVSKLSDENYAEFSRIYRANY